MAAFDRRSRASLHAEIMPPLSEVAMISKLDFLPGKRLLSRVQMSFLAQIL
jgi:hypothetical protein